MQREWHQILAVHTLKRMALVLLQHSTHELRQTVRKEELDIDRAERDLRADEPLDLAALHDSVNVSSTSRNRKS